MATAPPEGGLPGGRERRGGGNSGPGRTQRPGRPPFQPRASSKARAGRRGEQLGGPLTSWNVGAGEGPGEKPGGEVGSSQASVGGGRTKPPARAPPGHPWQGPTLPSAIGHRGQHGSHCPWIWGPDSPLSGQINNLQSRAQTSWGGDELRLVWAGKRGARDPGLLPEVASRS